MWKAGPEAKNVARLSPIGFVKKLFHKRVTSRERVFEERPHPDPRGTRTFFGDGSQIVARSRITSLNKRERDSLERG